MADGVVQVAPDSTGKRIDTAELARADGTLVERQRVVIADDGNVGATLGLDTIFRTGRQMAELKMIGAQELTINAYARRHGERAILADRRGNMNRGTVR